MINDVKLRDHILKVFQESPDHREVTQALIKFIQDELKFNYKLTPELQHELVHRFFYEKCCYGVTVPYTRKDDWKFGIELESGKLNY